MSTTTRRPGVAERVSAELAKDRPLTAEQTVGECAERGDMGLGAGRHGRRGLRILLVTPEISYLPTGMGRTAKHLAAKAGGLADAAASLVSAFDHMGVDIHVALPNYRRLFAANSANLGLGDRDWRSRRPTLPRDRIHLAEDRAFYYREKVYGSGASSDLAVALAFQREVLNNIFLRVEPDLIHCHDWMTGLIPAVARRLGVPCLFTLHNIHSHQVTLEQLENCGIDAASFWDNLYYQRAPRSYEESRTANAVDLLSSALFSADVINTVSPAFLQEIVWGYHDFIPPSVRQEITNKRKVGRARGILNAPDPSYDPASDPCLIQNYRPEDLVEGKRANKLDFQRETGLAENGNAPLLFWPSRLDPAQKGPQLLAEILYQIIESYREENLQIAVVADGPFQGHLREIVNRCRLNQRVCVRDFNESLSRRGFAASDFTLIPSSFEPCGLAQMVAQLYGSLPIVHATGGLRDTVQHLDLEKGTGNGFVFEYHDAAGFRWAIDRALEFHRLVETERAPTIARVMRQAKRERNYTSTARMYGELYSHALTAAR